MSLISRIGLATLPLLFAQAPLSPAFAKDSKQVLALKAGQAQPITAKERQAGAAAHPSILAEYGGAYTGKQAAVAVRVGQKIAVQSGLSASPGAFDVTMLDSAINNAFAIPGGYVYTTRQLVALMNDEAELAAVLGHEVAHVAARHSDKRQSTATRNQVLGVLGQVLVGAATGNSGFGSLLGKGIGVGSQLMTLGYSRGQETEADDLGVRYLARAGYDPTALGTMLMSLGAQTDLDTRISGGSGPPPVWASTHPNNASRVARAFQQASLLPRGGVRNRDAFLSAIDGMMYGENPAQGVVEGQQFLYPKARFAFSAPQGFAISNAADAVSISGTGGQAQFTMLPYDGNLDHYVTSALQKLAGSGATVPPVSAQRTQVNGLTAAYVTTQATANGTPVDLTVFAYALSATSAAHFVLYTPQGQGLGPLAPLVQSFKTMTAAEAAAVKPRFLRVVTVKAGDSVQSLAARMVYSSYQVERFRVLNALAADATVKVGQKVKIVTW